MEKCLAVLGRKNLSVGIHPAALPAYEFFHKQAMRFSQVQLGNKCLSEIYSSNIYRATQISKKKLLLFSGFEVVGFTPSKLNIKDVTIVLCNDFSDQEIESYAWKSVLKSIFSSIDCHYLEPLRKDLNSSRIPPSLFQSLFNTSSLTQDRLAQISVLSVSGLKKQSRPSEEGDIGSFEIFSQLKSEIGGSNDVN